MTGTRHAEKPWFSAGFSTPHADPQLSLASTLRDIFEVFAARKRMIGVIAVTGTVLTAISAFAGPRMYTAEAQIGMGGLPGSAETDRVIDDSFLETQLVMLNSPEHLHRVVAKLELATGEEAVRPVPTSLSLRRELRIFQAMRSRVIVVQVRNRNPRRAAALANVVADAHIDNLRDASRQDEQDLLAYLDRQIEEIGVEVQNADRAVQVYRVTHGIDGTDQMNLQTIADVTNQLALARIEQERSAATLRRLEQLERSGVEKNVAAIADLIGYDLPTEGAELPVEPAAHRAPDPKAAAPTVPEALRGAISQFKSNANAAAAAVEQLQDHLKGLQAAANAQLDHSARLGVLERKAAAASKIFDELLSRRQETLERVARATVGVRVINHASEPERPDSRGALLMIVPGLFAFSLLGCAVALTLDRFGPTIGTRRHCVESLGVPCVEFPYRGGSIDLEKIQELVLLALNPGVNGGLPHVVLVAACTESEGRSDLALRFARSAAQLCQRVVLIDLNDTTAGDAAVRTGMTSLSWDAPAGAVVQLPASAIGLDEKEGMRGSPQEELARLGEHCDCVVINGPPVRSSGLTVALAGASDSIIIMLDRGRTDRSAAASVFALLRQALTHVGAKQASLIAALMPTAVQPGGIDGDEASRPRAFRPSGSDSWHLLWRDAIAAKHAVTDVLGRRRATPTAETAADGVASRVDTNPAKTNKTLGGRTA